MSLSKEIAEAQQKRLERYLNVAAVALGPGPSRDRLDALMSIMREWLMTTTPHRTELMLWNAPMTSSQRHWAACACMKSRRIRVVIDVGESTPPGWIKEHSSLGIHEFYRHESGVWVWLGTLWYANAVDWPIMLGPFKTREKAMSAALARQLL